MSPPKTILTLGVLLPGALAASEPCTRSLLRQVAARYVAAQSLGESRYLSATYNFTTNLLYTENDVAMNVSAGILSRPIKIDHHRSIYDRVQCATYTEVISADPSHPYVIGTQIRVTPSANGTAQITSIESRVTDEGDWLFNAQHTLHYALKEDWDPRPASELPPTPRAVIQAAGDAYLDLFLLGNGSVPVPWGVPCNRLEGGLYTAAGDTCESGVPSGVNITERRYVIDEEAGVVDIFCAFGSSKLPDSHEYKVENGKIRYVHTITACTNAPNCGFSDLPEILQQDIGF